MKGFRCGLAAAVVVTYGALHAATASAALTDTEAKCASAVAKSYAKLEATILKTKASCHAGDISGDVNDPNACDPLPAAAADKITKAKNKFVSSIAKSCSSTCSTSTSIRCTSSLSCPPKHQASPANNASAESCVGFDLKDLGWPGPYCESILGHTMRAPEDLGTCLVSLVDVTTNSIDKAIYASLDETSGLTASAQSCVAAIDKTVQKSLSKAHTAAAACRTAREQSADPETSWSCALDDADTVAAVQKVVDKLGSTIDKACTNADIASLDGLCAAAGVTPASTADAKSCLGQMVREVAAEEHDRSHHVFASIGMLNATRPRSAFPYCGDGIVTATREEHTGVGEECDGDNDAACGAGSCFPPGDLFECTCTSTPRERFVVKGDALHSDSDAGWKGASHNATHNDGFGYVLGLTNCDCGGVSQATCTGSTSNPVCDAYGNMAPRCSNDPHGTQTCDEHGNLDGDSTDRDCFACDADSINEGAYCGAGSASADETACQSQCFDDATGLAVVPQTPCSKQADCGDGRSCKGRCDNSITCTKMSEGSPLPQVSAEISVCIMLEYQTDITGTLDMVSGDTLLHYSTDSLIRYGATQAIPCPICGGTCVGGTNAGDHCSGRCDSSHATCLTDADCTAPGDTACLETDDDCSGGSCSLELRCWNGANAGNLCLLDYESPLGPVSHDCPPAGNPLGGIHQHFGDVTTGTVQFPSPGAPCTDDAWHNYDCPCPADADFGTCSAGRCSLNSLQVCTDDTDCYTAGVPTHPNGCAAACNAGVNVGKACATTFVSSGIYTTCVGGTDNGYACDEDADCEGGTCSGNPHQCIAGAAATIGAACSTNGDCGIGGDCEDACPGGRCVPLCEAEGKCTGGGRDGDRCATVDQCRECTAGNAALLGHACVSNAECDTNTSSGDGVCQPAGGVTCDLNDPEDGLCAAGPVKYRCTGLGHQTEPCELNYGTCSATKICLAGDQHQGATCTTNAFCGTGGVCSNRCTTGSPDKRDLACSVNSDCIDVANVPVSRYCETGADSIPGTADDVIGAGECEPVPQDCFVNNGIATGGGTANEPQVNAAFCVLPSDQPAVNDASGFGGPSRIRRTGESYINVPSFP